MRITYAQKSVFQPDLDRELNVRRLAICDGQCVTVTIQRPRPGYSGDVEVTISKNDQKYFSTNWSGNDPSRFAARIRAAATALRNNACWGRFHITHEAGVLTIQRL